MAKLDISEKRLPQDGRIKIKVKIDNRSRELDFRVSTLPTLFGEKIVLRLLDKDKLMLDMTKLGFEAQNLWKFSSAISPNLTEWFSSRVRRVRVKRTRFIRPCRR